MKKITLPQTIKIIGKEGFSGCGLEELILPRELEVIEDSAFLKCKGLRNVVIPPKVRKIGRWAFHGCLRLQHIYFEGEPLELGEWLFNKGGTTIHCQKGSIVDFYCKKYEYHVDYTFR